MTFDRISIQTFSFKKIAVNLMLESIQRAGFKKFEFYAAAPHFCHFADLPATAEEVGAMVDGIRLPAAKLGLAMDCFAPESVEYAINIASEDNAIREKSVRYFLDYLEDLPALDCKAMLVTSGWGYFDKDKLASWQRSKASLVRIARRAEELGVKVYLRPISKATTNLVNSLPSLVRMLAEVNSPALLGCIDAAILAENGETISDYFEVIPDKIGHYRFYNLMSDGTEISAGTGLDNVKAVFEELDRCGYQGSVGLEMNFEHLVDPDLYAGQIAANLKSIF